VSLKWLRDLRITGNDVGFTIMLTTPACRSGQMRPTRAAR
jgi:hypothetical protein